MRLCHPECDTASWSQAWGQSPPPERTKRPAEGRAGCQCARLAAAPEPSPDRSGLRGGPRRRASESGELALSVEQEICLRDTLRGAR